MKERIIFILPTLTHPRHHKRVNALKDQFSVEVFAFDRGVYQINQLKGVNITRLGRMENKQYFRRVLNYIKVLSVIRKNKDKNTKFYFFSLDFAFIGALFLKKNQYIYEIGDFAYLGLPKKLVSILTRIDLKIIKKAYRTILTSDGFSKYLKDKSNTAIENLTIIPNRPPRQILEFKRKHEKFGDDQKLRFGFVGILRYPKTVFRLVKLIAEKYPRFEFVFYGDGGLVTEFQELCKNHSNLSYKGSFKNPEDLSKIYNDFDIHIACYDITGLNQKLAEPNKFYESVYFGNPLIATKGSFFGDKVENLDIGYTLGDFSMEALDEFLDNITLYDLDRFRTNMLKIDEGLLVDSDSDIVQALIS